MKTDIINYCNNTKTIYGISDLFKKSFLKNLKKLKPNQRPLIMQAQPYLYRMWYYSALCHDTALSPANFINSQITEKYHEDSIVVPIASPVYVSKILKNFSFEYKVFSVESHPILEDMKLLLQQCSPDIAIQEDGLLIEKKIHTFLNSFCFKEIFYVTFLTNIAYELNLLKKMPSINTYRAIPVHKNIAAFFNLPEAEGLKQITEATISIASRILSDTFTLSTKTFSKDSLRILLKDPQDLNKYLDEIFTEFNLDINVDLGELVNLEDLDFDSIKNVEDLNIPNETLMALALKYELCFLLDVYLITPLGYYLQLIKPIYMDEMDFQMSFEQLLEASDSKIPLIKFFFMMGNGYDLTSLGINLLCEGKPPKNQFQEFIHKINFEETYKDILNDNSEVDINLN